MSEVDLQRVGRSRIPCFDDAQRGAPRRGSKSHIRVAREQVGQHQPLRQAEQKYRHALGDVVGAWCRQVGCQKLRHNVARSDDRASDQVREERDESSVRQQAGIDTLAAKALHQVHDLLEGEEAYRQRQEDPQLRRIQPKHVVDHEVGVFEPAQQREVRRNARDQPASRAAPMDSLTEPIIGQDRSGQQQDEFRVPPTIEEQARGDDPAQCPARPADAASEEEAAERDRQTAQDEFR